MRVQICTFGYVELLRYWPSRNVPPSNIQVALMSVTSVLKQKLFSQGLEMVRGILMEKKAMAFFSFNMYVFL